MFQQRAKRSCFIIGSMRDGDQGENARLRVLASQVIRPLLEQFRAEGIDYDVHTPYQLTGGNIMRDVIYHIDRADLIIADLTDGIPNVFYELGLCHALGRPTIAVMEKRDGTPPKVEFDIAAYRVYLVELEKQKYLEARETLRPAIQTAHRSISLWSTLENPVIDFFRAPITYISPAYALAEGYYWNFIKPALQALVSRRGSGEYRYDIGRAKGLQQEARKMDVLELFDNSVRSKLELHVIIPSQIELTQHHYVDRMRGKLLAAGIEGDGRTYSCFYRSYDSDSKHALVDIPTAVRNIESAVDRRMRDSNNIDRESDEWRSIEQQEIQRFILSLQKCIQEDRTNNADSKGRIKILFYNRGNPSENNMRWIDSILLGE